MNIEGLDYNSGRTRLVLPEYGREIQRMVDHALTLPTKEERQQAANAIIHTMHLMVPSSASGEAGERKLWDHLAVMSGFQLDIDWPYDLSEAAHSALKPEPLGYPMSQIRVRHYGKMLFELFDKLKAMPAGEERDALTRYTANQMKRSLMLWFNGANEEERVISDLARYTDGVIQLDPQTFKFERMTLRDLQPPTTGKKKKR